MPQENESKRILKLSGPMPAKSETSADFPQVSTDFRTVPNLTEEFGKVPQVAESRENHTLTVREAARMFEAASVARTERTIINWCQPNRQGIARLDSYFDPNERKYYITPQSVEAVIQEEIQRSKKSGEATDSAGFGSAVTHVKQFMAEKTIPPDDRKLQELEREVQNLKIANEVKDKFIELIKNERKGFIDKLIAANRAVGQLETKLNQLDATKLV